MTPTIEIVKPEEWEVIKPTMSKVFQNGMPTTPEQSTFLGVFDKGLVGWLHVEHLFHFNCVYLEAQYRQPGLALRLISEAASRLPAGHSAIWLTDRNVDSIARRLGARRIGTFNVYRKDV